ncbi:putative interleukin 17-like protein isoform X2 [Apostichopus japonicus]|uniref:Putative interleukin 17-like protein isoform X2 n=1 Tax=Stichopus japonicus TaxID=307972 RepID=A0A2G8JLM2_STIJA|nr:putative interleukin 17-like protein isoform X2 [Apostichopus japonicus]
MLNWYSLVLFSIVISFQNLQTLTTLCVIAGAIWTGSEAAAVPTGSLPKVGECSFPDNEAYNRFVETRSSYYPFEPVYGVQLFNETESQRREINEETNPYGSEATKLENCPAGQKPSSIYKTNPAVGGTCPWTYDIDHDADRIPTTIGVARCLCDQGCLDPLTSKPRNDLVCRAVKYNMKVLYREGCSNGLYQYRSSTLEVPVACTCMRLS